MDQTSNSLLGKAVRSRAALHSVGNALLRGQENPAPGGQENANLHLVHGEAIDLRPEPMGVSRAQEAPVPRAQPATEPVQQTYNRPSRRSETDTDVWTPLIDPRKLFRAIANAKKLIAVLSIVGLVLGAVYAKSIPKYFYATVEILIDPRDLQISERELLPTGLPYDASLALVENQTRILTSRRVIEGTVEKLNLDQDDEYNGKGLDSPGSIGALRAIIFGRESDDPSKAQGLAVENLLEVTGVSRAPKTFVISLTVRSQSADKAALIANTMAEVYMNVQDEIQSDTVGRANGELGGRLEELRGDVEKAERLVEAYRSENELFDANGKLISDDEIVSNSTQLSRAREKVSELRARADSARELTVDAVLSDALPEGAASNLIAELRRGYAGKVQQRDALSEKLGAQHPQLRTAEAEVSSAKRGIEAELRRLSQTAQIELQRAIKTEQDLAAGQARLKSKQSTISESLVRLRELEREAAARRSVYEALLLRARETGEQAGISTANTTIVSKAVSPLRPYGTSRKIIALSGMAAGFMLGVVLALLGALWSAVTRVEPENAPGHRASDFDADAGDDGSRQIGRLPPEGPSPTGGGKRTAPSDPKTEIPRTTRNDTASQTGDPMYYPFFAPQHGLMHGSMMAPAPAPQAVMPQQMMQPIMPQMMPQIMQPYPYGQPMMQQPMMQQPMMMPQMAPQMMQPYPYAQPQMMLPQMMQPVIYQAGMHQPAMHQPVMHQPVMQPVYTAVPQPAPSYQSAPAPQAVPTESDYSEIRGRLQALRDGIVNLADGRDRLSKLG